MYSSSAPKQRLRPQQSSSADLAKAQGEVLPENAVLLGHVLQSQETLLALMRLMGGCTLRIPRAWSYAQAHGHPLLEVLSKEQMQRVVLHFGGTDMYIPKGSRYFAQQRNSSIIATFTKGIRQGHSSSRVVRELAKEHGLSDRRVWGILKTCPSVSSMPKQLPAAYHKNAESNTYDIDMHSQFQ